MTETGNPTAPEGRSSQAAYSLSSTLVARLAALRCSFVASSYRSGILYFVGGGRGGSAQLHLAGMPAPMGIHYDGVDSLTLACATEIIRFRDMLRTGGAPNRDVFDACFAPRTVHVTGFLDAHDVGVDASGNPVFINTRFNCIATVSAEKSFRQLWKPPFISALVNEDRCHLNGLAMEDGRPRYVTAVSRSDTIDGWRDRRADGGVVVDVEKNEIVCDGLSMPHSPRLHRGELWVLNAGTGELGRIAFDTAGRGRFEPIAFCPGFLRGLSFCGDYAFVGLSKPRYSRFEGLALDKTLRDRDSEPWCGVQIIELSSGTCVDWFRIDGGVTEIYDVEALPGLLTPMALGYRSDEAANAIVI
jgi:uncharacterized protein (TIGR03032 family)